MGNRVVNYKCDACGVVGELDEYYDSLDCPECGGTMLPLNTLEELTSVDFVPPVVDEDATISIPRDFIPKTKSGIKVATAVDIGFGGMLSASSVTGRYRPSTQNVSPPSPSASGTSIPASRPSYPGAATTSLQNQPPPPPPPTSQGTVLPGKMVPPPTASPVRGIPVGQVVPPAPPNTGYSAPPPPPARQPTSSATSVGGGSGKKSFTLGKKPSASQTSVGSRGKSVVKPERSQPAPQPPPQKKGLNFKKTGSAPGAQQFANKPAGGSQDVSARPAGHRPGMQQSHGAGRPVESRSTSGTGRHQPASNRDVEAAQTQPAVPIQKNLSDPKVASRELESAALDQAAKFAALQAELDVERQARIEAETRMAEERARLKAEEDAKIVCEAAEKVTREAVEKARREATERIERERQEAQSLAQEKIKAEFEAKRKQESDAPNPDSQASTAQPTTPTPKGDDNPADAAVSKKPDGEKSVDKPSGQAAAVTKGTSPRKGGMPPAKKGMLPPPKGMSGIKGGPKPKPGSSLPGKTGTAPAASAEGAKDVKNAEKPSDTETKISPTKTGTNMTKDAMTLGVTSSGLVRLYKKKNTHLNLIVGIGVAVVCSAIFVVAYFMKNGVAPKKPTGLPPTTRENMNTIRPDGSRPRANNGGVATTKSISPLNFEFNDLNRRTKVMNQNAAEIEEAIKLWQEFVDKHEAEYPSDERLKLAKELIKTLKDLKSMY